VRRLGIDETVDFVGKVAGPEKTALYRAVDIFCFASLVMEGQPLVILEAMAEGLPVISTHWPGIADTVLDGETGLLVTSPTPEEYAERIVQLAEHPEDRVRLGVAGRARYEAYYTQEAFGKRMLEVIRPFALDPGESDGSDT
jgi:glycosyltransferase involved in cell wall biosynthesis